jgi:TolA-binding protein
LLGGCASVSDVTGMATQQDLLEVRTQVALLQQSTVRAKSEADAARAQLERRERERIAEEDRQLQALGQRLDSLTNALSTLAGRVEELNTRTDALTRQPRVAAPAPAPAPAPVPAPAPAPAPPSTPPAHATATARPATASAPVAPPPAAPAPAAPAPTPPSSITAVPAEPTPGSRPSTNPLQPQDIYQAAYIDFSKGSYQLAIAGFREFLRRFPDHQLAGAAQYWIGEAYFSIARGFTNAGQADKATEGLEQAVQEFRKVQANYARSDKTATALYKEALALLELKQPAVAQARLQYLVDNFPQAEEAPLARERLTALKPNR